jgi:hypothetical protein
MTGHGEEHGKDPPVLAELISEARKLARFLHGGRKSRDEVHILFHEPLEGGDIVLRRGHTLEDVVEGHECVAMLRDEIC